MCQHSTCELTLFYLFCIKEIRCLLCPSGSQEVTFCAIKSLLFNGLISNLEHFSLKIGHNYVSVKLENCFFQNKLFYYYITFEPILAIEVYHVFQNPQCLMSLLLLHFATNRHTVSTFTFHLTRIFIIQRNKMNCKCTRNLSSVKFNK